MHGLVVNVPGSEASSACAGTDNKLPQSAATFRSCSVADCALGSCVANSAMRSDYPMLYSLSYDKPVIIHQSLDARSGKSVYGPTRGGWLMTIIGQNFGNVADGNVSLEFISSLHLDAHLSFFAVINVSVSSSVFNNMIKSDTFGKYLNGKAVCRIPCTPGSPADGVWQIPGTSLNGEWTILHDQYQCNTTLFYAGTGNRFVSDTHIVCIAPAGVGLSQGLTVAVGSTQLDGPSPVPNERSETQYGQIHSRGATEITLGADVGSPVHVASVLTLFGPGECNEVKGVFCTTSKSCGLDGACSASGAIVVGLSAPKPDLSQETAVGVVSANYDLNTLNFAEGSWNIPVTAEQGIVRVPGINLMDSDSQLDQMQYAYSMFSYERPSVFSVMPKLGAVMLTRQITIDGINFGIQSRYIEVRVAGIPYKLHPFGAAWIEQEHVCCKCYWQCSGSPRTCSCQGDTSPVMEEINGTCVDPLGTSVTCPTFSVAICKVFSVHEQLQTLVPNMYTQFNQGLVPLVGLIPKQSLSPSVGDKQFQLCVIADPWCPLSSTPDTYINYFLTVHCPKMTKPETILIVGYSGISPTQTDPTQFYMVTLADSLSIAPACDDSLKVCCSYTMLFQDYFSSMPNFNYYDRYHPFPGFCGQHLVRAVIDGYESFDRSMQKENLNLHSLLYYDDKPVSCFLMIFQILPNMPY